VENQNPFELPGRYRELREEAERLARQVEPFAADADSQRDVDERVLHVLKQSGLCSVLVPSAYGGRDEEIDPVAVCVIREVLMPTSSHLDSLFALQGIGTYAITRCGSEDQRRHWLPRVARAEALAALALTEPQAGSDLKAITTTVAARPDGLELSGAKSFISNAGAASFYTVLARENNAFSLVLVPAEAEGLTIERSPDLIAPHVLGDLTLDRVRLPASARIGAPGTGLDGVVATLAVFRVSVAAAAIGIARSALDEAVAHAATRVQFGRPLARLGQVAAMLADSWAEVEMARLLTYRAALRVRRDPVESLPDSSMAKLAATETAARVVDRAVQIMGRFGLVADSKVERLYRQARPMRIYEGASEVLREGLARSLVEARSR